jgi:putative transposase
MVQPHFDPSAPNVLWVADFTYVSIWSEWVYAPFVIDAYRRILGWRTATGMNTQLVLDAIEHAIRTRACDGITDLTGLIHHHDRGGQYASIAFTERLRDADIDASVGPSATAMTTPWPDHKRPLQDRTDQGAWRTADDVQIATLEWVDWFNHRRLYEHCGDIPPAELQATTLC